MRPILDIVCIRTPTCDQERSQHKEHDRDGGRVQHKIKNAVDEDRKYPRQSAESDSPSVSIIDRGRGAARYKEPV